MKVKPLHDYKLIEPDKPIERIGGILVSRQRDAESGVVVAIGPYADLGIGERIMYKDFNTLSVKRSVLVKGKDQEKELTFIKYEDVICIIE